MRSQLLRFSPWAESHEHDAEQQAGAGRLDAGGSARAFGDMRYAATVMTRTEPLTSLSATSQPLAGLAACLVHERTSGSEGVGAEPRIVHVTIGPGLSSVAGPPEIRAMRRRSFLAAVLAALVPPSRAATAQNTKAPSAGRRTARIGVLAFGTFADRLDSLREGLRSLGYVEGRDFVLESREGEGRQARLASLARELVALEVDVLVGNSTPVIEALKAATSTIPIVMAPAGDAFGSGLVTSLARPGGNVTGLSLALVEMAGKTMEMLQTVVPQTKRLGCLVQENDPLHLPFLSEAETAAARLGLPMQPAIIRAAAEVETAFGAMASQGVGAVLIQPILVVHPNDRTRLIALGLRHRLPTASGLASFAEAGGLLTYAAEFKDTWRRAAVYVDKLLKGARAGDLPVERPTTFTLIINVKTARALGLTIQSSVLARADRLIQ